MKVKYRCGLKFFKTLKAACAYAEKVFREKGLVLGIEAVERKETK